MNGVYDKQVIVENDDVSCYNNVLSTLLRKKKKKNEERNTSSTSYLTKQQAICCVCQCDAARGCLTHVYPHD